jgi:TetR/AcrR family transcriptional regulator, mexJK operon transcriptional repressor
VLTKNKIEPTRKTSKAPRGRPPLTDSDRKRILDATTAAFLEDGYARASTSEIARRARTSKQTLYALFPTKADLFVAVISAHTDTLFAKHIEYIESNASPREALTDIGCRILKMFSAPQFLALYRIVVAEAPNFPDLARQLWHTCMARGRVLLGEYLRSRRIGGPSYGKSAAQFITFVLGDYVINAMLNPDLELSERALRTRVREAVNDFICLHPLGRVTGRRQIKQRSESMA